MNKRKRNPEAIKKYKKKLKTIKADVRIEYKEKLDMIVKNQKISIAEWLRRHIDEDMKNVEANK